ncbi:hypothetical protein Q1695_007611 [Nippostrongylus brasiliensis]|nr:hypothetical protein Q1695_007611 [Nippostrongylus brasiliensis]
MLAGSSRFEFYCIVLLGLGHMCIFIGYDAQTFLVESVLHSVNARDDNRIDAHAGYYGQATCYVAYMLACLFTPSLLPILSAKWALFLGSLSWTIYHIGFLYLNSYFYYFSSALMGVGFAFFYSGYTAYLTSHSSRNTIEQNSAITWSIGNLCLLFGGVVLLVVFVINNGSTDDQLMEIAVGNNSSSPVKSVIVRDFTDTDIFWMYATFAAITLCSNVIFALIPSRDADGCIESGRPEKSPLLKEIRTMLTSFVHVNMLLLTPLFIHIGFVTAFWLAVYPTTFIFTESLVTYQYLPAFYSAAAGLGEIAMGVVITIGSRVIRDFGLMPTTCLSAFSTMAVLVAIAASVPEWSTVMPTNDPPWLIQPSVSLTLAAAFTFGMIDSATNTARNVGCAVAMPEARAHAFAISKIFQALAGAVAMVLSSRMSIYHHFQLLIVTTVLSTIAVGVLHRRIRSTYSE